MKFKLLALAFTLSALCGSSLTASQIEHKDSKDRKDAKEVKQTASADTAVVQKPCVVRDTLSAVGLPAALVRLIGQYHLDTELIMDVLQVKKRVQYSLSFHDRRVINLRYPQLENLYNSSRHSIGVAHDRNQTIMLLGVTVYDNVTRKKIVELEYRGESHVHSIIRLKSGFFATSHGDDTITLFDNTGRYYTTLAASGYANPGRYELRYSELCELANNTLAALVNISDTNNMVALWDLHKIKDTPLTHQHTQPQTDEIPCESGSKFIAAHMLSNNYLALGTSNGDIILVDSAHNNKQIVLKNDDSTDKFFAMHMTESSDGTLLAALYRGHKNTYTKVWHMTDFRCIKTIQAYSEGPCVISPKSNTIFIREAMCHQLLVYDPYTDKTTSMTIDGAPILYVQPLKDEHTLLIHTHRLGERAHSYLCTPHSKDLLRLHWLWDRVNQQNQLEGSISSGSIYALRVWGEHTPQFFSDHTTSDPKCIEYFTNNQSQWCTFQEWNASSFMTRETWLEFLLSLPQDMQEILWIV